MNAFKLGSIALVLTFAGSFPATAADALISTSGNAFLAQCGPSATTSKGVCYVYVTGLTGGINVSQSASKKKFICLPQEGNMGQFTDVINAYIQANPVDRHRATSVLAYLAFLEAYPCSG